MAGAISGGQKKRPPSALPWEMPEASTQCDRAFISHDIRLEPTLRCTFCVGCRPLRRRQGMVDVGLQCALPISSRAIRDHEGALQELAEEERFILKGWAALQKKNPGAGLGIERIVERASGATLYEVKLPDERRIQRRFSAFRGLHRNISRDLGLGAFPCSRRLTHPLSAKIARAEELEEYLRKVLAKVSARHAGKAPHSLRAFLELA